MSHQNELVRQVEGDIIRLEHAVDRQDAKRVRQSVERLNGIRSIMGPTPLTDLQRRRLRAIAHQIERSDSNFREQVGEVPSALHQLSMLGLRRS